jgi:hypothetical protein
VLPNLFTIGAMKCGTTSLHHYLSLHPEISMSDEKETNFFVDELDTERDRDWYEAQFDPRAPVRGESSTNYSNCLEFGAVPERIHALVPDAKLIYLLRDPVDRVVSDYRQHRQLLWEERDIASALGDLEENLYVSRSRYWMQLERWLELFAPDQVLIATQEELKRSRSEVLREVFEFLDVDPSFTSHEFEELRFTSDEQRRYTRATYRLRHMPKPRLLQRVPDRVRAPVRALAYRATTAAPEPRPELPGGLRERLVEFLAPDVEHLRRFSGRSFEDWSV